MEPLVCDKTLVRYA